MASLHGFMTPDEMLQQTRDNECVAFKLLVEEIGHHGSKPPYCFVEGYDLPYYSSKVEAFAEENAVFINCGGKKGVLKGCDFISSKPDYSHYTLLYFVDRDYDDNSAVPPGVFVTDGYSVENYYMADSVIVKFCKGYCRVTKDKEQEIDGVVREFQAWKEQLVAATAMFCAWYDNIRDRGDRHVDEDELPPDLRYKTSFPSRYVEINSKGIYPKPYSLEDLNSDYRLDNPVSQEEIDNSMRKIRSIYDIRGKYAIQMLQEFIDFIKNDAKGRKRIFSKNFSFEKNNATILARLGFASEWSPRLRDYISGHC
ncbi:MAG: DUF4435 domain-containing protein [Muribaculaceae bacterium]|nr:DUF4435 domain-containing protein [Muribaculaceae bacterium]